MDSTASPSELGRAGQRVAGKYRLDAVIGRGGMGTVWSATHLSLGQRLAIKLIAREFVRSPEALRRFDAEAKTAARLQSRHVVQVFDNGTLDDGTPYIAMELLDGENLSDRIERHGALALPDTVEIIAQCCKALGRAHAAGIVHRDIKPDNIFLAREPDEDVDVAKILDFGVAKMALGLDNVSQVTGTGALLGTPLYMSPEQIRGSRDVDHRADLYALGLVVYTMLTGQLAIAGESFGDILVNICTRPLPSLGAVAPWLPYAMEAWFQRTCAREPGDRCQSAQELIDTLRTAASGGPARAIAAVGSGASLMRPSAPVRVDSGSPDYRQSAAVAPTLAAQGATTHPGIAPAAPPVAPGSYGGPGVSRGPDAPGPLASHGLPYASALSQSAAAVSVTAAGLPRRPRAMMIAVAVGALAALGALGGVVVFAVSSSRHDSAALASPSAVASSAALSVSTAVVPALAPPSAPALVVDASASAGSAPSALPAKPAVALVPAPPRGLVPPAIPAYPPIAAPGHPPSPRPASPSAPVDVGY
jgi:serine/threonine protein kinase